MQEEVDAVEPTEGHARRGEVGCVSGMEYSIGKGMEAREGSQELRAVVQCGWSQGCGRANGGPICSGLFLDLGIVLPGKQHYTG